MNVAYITSLLAEVSTTHVDGVTKADDLIFAVTGFRGFAPRKEEKKATTFVTN